MVTLDIYENSKQMPPLIKQQVVDFLRVQWPEGFVKENRLRNWITKESQHPVNFVLSEEDVVVGHLEVVWKTLEHEGVSYKTYGLTGVLTYPQFRGEGHGLRLLKEAKGYILRQPDVDIVMFNSPLQGFYEKGGFERMDNVVTLEGDPDNPTTSKASAFMLFISEKGKKGKPSFEKTPVYFGDETW